jgi:hypothetical protein
MSEHMICELRHRIVVLQRTVLLLALCLSILAGYVALAVQKSVNAAEPQVLKVKRIAVVDDKGTERVVIAAPLPDPIVLGKREKRDGPVSGILIFDPKGNERGGYVTSDTQDLRALLTLDSEKDQSFTAVADAKNGATVWVTNEKHDTVALSTHDGPLFEVVKNGTVIYKRPANAASLH